MAYADDIDQDYHRVGFYIRFRGIPTRISTHDPADWANWSPSETFAATLIRDSMSGIDETLERSSSVVSQGGFSFEVMATDEMVSLFARRGGTEDTLSAAVSATGTTLTFVDNLAPTTGVAYIDRETVNITGNSGSDRTVTRGYEDSVGAVHAVGAVLSTKPRFWYTRRFTVFAVNLETGTEAALYTGTLDSSPSFADGKFSFSGTGVINSYLQRPLHTGWQEIQSTETVANGEKLEITVADGEETKVMSPGFLRITGSSGAMIAGGFALANQPTITTGQINVPNASFVAGDPTNPTDLAGERVSVEQVDVPTGTPGQVALQAILSIEGDASNGYWDTLSGRRADTSGSDENFRDLRMGAGITAADVDQASFNTIHSDSDIAVWLDETISLGDFLTEEILFRSGGYVYATPAGVLTHKQYTSSAVRGALTAYTPDDVLTSSVVSVDDETGGIARVIIQCNYRPFSREYLRQVELVFRDDRALYGDVGESLSLRSKSINVATSRTGIANTSLFTEDVSLLELETTFDRQRARQSWAGRRMSLRLPWRHHNTFTIGYRFSWTDTRDIDHEGSTGVSGRYYEVTSRALDLGTGEMHIDCDEVPRGWLIAPSGFVASWTGGTNTITLDTTTDLHDTSPGLDFNKWYVTVYDASTNFADSDTVEVSSVTSSTLVLASTPSLSGGAAPAAGDLVVLSESDDRVSINDVGADVEDFAFAADSSYQVGASNKAGPRWS